MEERGKGGRRGAAMRFVFLNVFITLARDLDECPRGKDSERMKQTAPWKGRVGDGYG